MSECTDCGMVVNQLPDHVELLMTQEPCERCWDIHSALGLARRMLVQCDPVGRIVVSKKFRS
jgi:hypothetical protein